MKYGTEAQKELLFPRTGDGSIIWAQATPSPTRVGSRTFQTSAVIEATNSS
jgi:alkylation response protein AidB-like acyl-CoA dehydrogenase